VAGADGAGAAEVAEDAEDGGTPAADEAEDDAAVAPDEVIVVSWPGWAVVGVVVWTTPPATDRVG